MRKYSFFLTGALALSSAFVSAQPVNKVKFFSEEGLIDMTLTTDIRKLQNEKGEEVFQPATVLVRFPDSTNIEEPVTIAPRGHFRREYCNIPPVYLEFNNPTSPRLSPLGKLKMVIGCGTRGNDEQLLIKEYLIYKMYNILEDKSFRVRLVRLNYHDSKSRMKAFSQLAFLIEDDKELAARTGCVKKLKAQFLTEQTDRPLMTKVAVFEYLISNGDWSVPNNHNIKLVFDKENPNSLPYAIPYDFDHSGLVNASYALPQEELGTESVTERAYRGFPRTMDELQATFDVFRAKKEKVMAVISNCGYLTTRNKDEMTDYIEEFYKIIADKKRVQYIFITNARRQ